MHQVFFDLLESCFIYLDNILVLAIQRRIMCVISMLSQKVVEGIVLYQGFKALYLKKVEFLGYVVSEDGTSV